MGLRDVVGGGPLGFEGMGAALPECPGSFRALCRCAGQTTQEDNLVVGLAAAFGVKAMASSAADRGRSRPRLRLSEAAFSLPIVEQAGKLHHPSQARCGSLRTCSSASSWTDRKTSHKGRALAQS